MPAHSFGGHSGRSFYSQPATGSEHSFASIETVTDLGFTRHGDASDAIGTSDSQPQGLGSLHPDQTHHGWGRSNASTVDSGEEIREINAQTLAESLRSSSKEGKKDGEYFFPINSIQKTLTSYKVRQVLKKTFSKLSTAELDQLTLDICGAPRGMTTGGQPHRTCRQRLFAILLLGEKPQCIRCFVECGVDDNDLPLVAFRSPKNTQADITKSLTLYTRSDVEFKRAVKCFDNWQTFHREWFVDHQYAVLSPFFDLDPGNVCLYLLPSEIVLPFIESEEVVVGGQASVSKVLIHPAHHNFRAGQVTTHPSFQEDLTATLNIL